MPNRYPASHTRFVQRIPNPKGRDVVITGMTPLHAHKVTESGKVIFAVDLAEPAADADFEAEADFVSQIAFEKYGRLELAPVTQILTGMLQYVVRTVRRFEAEFT
jgi:hypothetical protein